MLKKSERISRSRLSGGPFKRINFAFGFIREIGGMPGAAVVVSKKNFPTAPLRNKIKRRIYAILRPLVRSGAIKRGYVVHPSKAATLVTFKDLQQEIVRALKQKERF